MADYIEREAASAECGFGSNKIKTPFAQIIVGGTADKPYYSIWWWDTEKKEGNIGYSSYNLAYVFKWLEEEFEITEDPLTVDVAPVVHGRWVNERMIAGGFAETWACDCSVCGETQREPLWKPNYCPNCGCRMDGGNE